VSRRHSITASLLKAVVVSADSSACTAGSDFKRPATPALAVYRVPGSFSTPAEGVAPAASESAASEYAQHFITGANPAGAVPGKRADYLRAVVVVWPSNTDGSIVAHASGIAVDVPAWGYQPSGRADRPNGSDAC
jgi:hypothetical protein